MPAGLVAHGEDEGGGGGEEFDAAEFVGGGVAAVDEVGAEGAEDGAGVGLDGHAPGSGEAEGEWEVAELSPFFVGEKIGRHDRAARGSRGGAGAEIGVWFQPVDGGEVVGRQIGRDAVAEQSFLIDDENGNHRAGAR